MNQNSPIQLVLRMTTVALLCFIAFTLHKIERNVRRGVEVNGTVDIGNTVQIDDPVRVIIRQ